MEEKTLTHRIHILSKKFYDSWISMFIFILLMSIVSIIQIILFTITKDSISGSTTESTTAWVSWIYLVISFPMGWAAMIGYVYSIRKDQRFFYYTLVLEIGYTISSLAGGLMFSSLIMIVMAINNTYRWQKIRREGEDYSVDKKKLLTVMWIVVFVIIIFGILSIELDTNHVFWWNEAAYGEYPKLVQYGDVIGTTLVAMGSFYMVGHSKWTFICYALTDVVYIILFSIVHQWSNVALSAVYLTLYLTAFASWINIKE